MNNPFPPDIPRDRHHEHALRLLDDITAKHPDGDHATVVLVLTHWLTVQATLGEIAAHIQRLDAMARKLADDASVLAKEQRSVTEGILSAACRRN